MFTQEQIAVEVKARQDASTILNQLAEGDGSDGYLCSSEMLDNIVRPLFRAAMHCDNEITALTEAGCWFEEY